MPRQKTEYIELVETHNIVMALKRVKDQQGSYDSNRWKRAIYHALSISRVCGFNELKQIRETLGLP